jgi:hypothetical protein
MEEQYGGTRREANKQREVPMRMTLQAKEIWEVVGGAESEKPVSHGTNGPRKHSRSLHSVCRRRSRSISSTGRQRRHGTSSPSYTKDRGEIGS